MVADAKEISGHTLRSPAATLLLALFMHDNTSKTRQSHATTCSYVCMFFFFILIKYLHRDGIPIGQI
jgi:hypothetical protein